MVLRWAATTATGRRRHRRWPRSPPRRASPLPDQPSRTASTPSTSGPPPSAGRCRGRRRGLVPATPDDRGLPDPDARVHRSVDTQVVIGTPADPPTVRGRAGASSWVSDNKPGRPDGETERHHVHPLRPHRPPLPTSDDTVRLPRGDRAPRPPSTAPWTPALRTAARSSTPPGCGRWPRHRRRRRARRPGRHPRDPGARRVRTGGHVHRARHRRRQCRPVLPVRRRWPPPASPTCGIVSTPDPLSYLGWIIGLSTAAAVVVPLLGGLPMAAAVAIAIVNLVIGPRDRPA